MAGPSISSVTASPRATGAIISWTTNEPSDSIVSYGTDPENLDLNRAAPALIATHSVSLGNLNPLTTYYFAVSSTDAAGNTTTSTGHSLTTQEISPILFVDDDEGDPLEGYFTAAMDANGYTHDIWDSYATGASPTASDMSAYSAVIWNTGYNYLAPTAGLTNSEQVAIAPISMAEATSFCRPRHPLQRSQC